MARERLIIMPGRSFVDGLLTFAERCAKGVTGEELSYATLEWLGR